MGIICNPRNLARRLAKSGLTLSDVLYWPEDRVLSVRHIGMHDYEYIRCLRAVMTCAAVSKQYGPQGPQRPRLNEYCWPMWCKPTGRIDMYLIWHDKAEDEFCEWHPNYYPAMRQPGIIGWLYAGYLFLRNCLEFHKLPLVLTPEEYARWTPASMSTPPYAYLSKAIQKLLTAHNGTLPRYAFPGGYQMLYLDSHNNVLCAQCAQDAIDDPSEFIEWKPASAFFYWEGEPLNCEQCGMRVVTIGHAVEVFFLDSEYGPTEPRINLDSLEIVEGCNGYYLYGMDENDEKVCLGCLGDGADRTPRLGDMTHAEWASAYGFEFTYHKE